MRYTLIKLPGNGPPQNLGWQSLAEIKALAKSKTLTIENSNEVPMTLWLVDSYDLIQYEAIEEKVVAEICKAPQA